MPNGCHGIKLYYETPKISLNDGNGIPLGNFSLVRNIYKTMQEIVYYAFS